MRLSRNGRGGPTWSKMWSFNPHPIEFISRGRCPYGDVLREQLRLRLRRQLKEIPDTLMTVEHPRVITHGRRPAGGDFILPPEELRNKGFEIAQANRGGRLTYHGPGQMVAYFIFSLAARRLTVPSFVRAVEETARITLQAFGIRGERHPDHPGVWVENRKIVSVGLAVDRGVSMHGLALNINPDLEDFEVIIPCGIQNCEVTSIYRETGRDPGFQEVEKTFRKAVEKVFL